MDKASAVVDRVLKNDSREPTKEFVRFKNHCGCSIAFCCLGRGNDKGNVESKMGYHRGTRLFQHLR